MGQIQFNDKNFFYCITSQQQIQLNNYKRSTSKFSNGVRRPENNFLSTHSSAEKAVKKTIVKANNALQLHFYFFPQDGKIKSLTQPEIKTQVSKNLSELSTRTKENYNKNPINCYRFSTFSCAFGQL